MKIVSARQMTALDREAIDGHHIPGLELMERAGTGIAQEVLGALEQLELDEPQLIEQPARVALLAGKGNNGGDAFVVARLLHGEGIETLTILVGAKPSELKGDAATNYARLAELRARIVEVHSPKDLEALRERCRAAALVVDGLLGTGLSGVPQGLMTDAIAFINSLDRPVVAVDIPSGISGDAGVPADADGAAGCFVRADLTVTMALPKLGCFVGPAVNGVGRLSVVDIGIPQEVVAGARSRGELLTPGEAAALLPERERLSHKGTYGRLLVLAGSRGYTGAAALVCNSAMRAGAGLVFLGIPESLNPILEAKCTETITLPLPETAAGTVSDEAYFAISHKLRECDAFVVGPGISTNEQTALLVRRLLAESAVPTMVDADGLNCLQGRADALHTGQAPVIITPHPGELARLTGLTQSRILADPWDAAAKTAKAHHTTCVLKGAYTCIATPEAGNDPAQVAVNIMGNAGMASGGVGDVLTGVIGALVAQGVTPDTAAKLGVVLHALAGDIALADGHSASLIATDLIQALPEAFRWLRARKHARRVEKPVTRCYYEDSLFM